MKVKDSLASIVLAGLGLVFGCKAIPTQEYLSRTIAPDINRWEQVNEKPPENLEDIKLVLGRSIIYGRERGEVWRSPRAALIRGYGDCDERAFLGAYLAGKIGYPRKIIAVGEAGTFEMKEGHVFTLLEKGMDNGIKYGLLDNALLVRPEYDSIKELLVSVNELCNETNPTHMQWNCYKIIYLDFSFPKNWVTTEKDLYDEGIQFGGFTRIDN